MTPQSLSQAELDDVYHLAIFDCDNMLAMTIREFCASWIDGAASLPEKQRRQKFRDDLHDALSAAFGKCEVLQLGEVRYAELMKRMMARGKVRDQ